MRTFYVAAITGHKPNDDGGLSLTKSIVTIVAWSCEEALEKAQGVANTQCPTDEGWSQHPIALATYDVDEIEGMIESAGFAIAEIESYSM